MSLKRGLFAICIAGLAGTACEEQPVRIQIKGPRDAVESTQAVPKFAPFEKKNDTIGLRASAFDKRKRYMGAANVKWESSDSSVASVNQSGVVTILGSGKAIIKASSRGYEKELESTMPVEVVIVEKIRWADPPPQEEALEMPMGEIKTFKAEVLNDRGEVIPDAKIEWNASSWAVTVTPTGEVEARAIGTAVVSATAKNGETVRHEIVVKDWEKKKKRRRRK